MSEDAELLAVTEAALSLAQTVLREQKRGGGLRRAHHAALLEPAREDIAKHMAGYFAAQLPHVIADISPRLRRALEPKHEASDDEKAKHFAAEVVPDAMNPLLFSATAVQAGDFDAAIQAVLKAAAEQFSRDAGSDAALSDDAVASYLRDRGLGKLTGELGETTIDELRTAIADAWKNGGGYDEIVQAAQAVYEDFSDYRAGLIAQTETNDAYNFGRHAMAGELGYEEKAWDPDGAPCPICLDNVRDGWIDIDEEFSSGDDGPTAHPNCDCGLSFRKTTPGSLKQSVI